MLAVDAVPAPVLALERPPYLGVSCREPNAFGCDRLGVAVWLERPVRRVRATVDGRPVLLVLPCGTARYREPCRAYCRRQVCGTYFEGFLQPAGLRDGPNALTPEGGRLRWTGRVPNVRTVRLAAERADGRTAVRALRVRVAAGWG